MRYRHLYILMGILCICMAPARAQSRVADSLWCDGLNNIIRCVSMAQVYEPVGAPSADTTDIAPFSPHVRLTSTDPEAMQRRYRKVTYLSDLQSTHGDQRHAVSAMDQWAIRFQHCLEGWDTARIANRDSTIDVKDYFITNGEDETTVRISIQKDSAFGTGYHVRITIY